MAERVAAARRYVRREDDAATPTTTSPRAGLVIIAPAPALRAEFRQRTPAARPRKFTFSRSRERERERGPAAIRREKAAAALRTQRRERKCTLTHSLFAAIYTSVRIRTGEARARTAESSGNTEKPECARERERERVIRIVYAVRCFSLAHSPSRFGYSLKALRNNGCKLRVCTYANIALASLSLSLFPSVTHVRACSLLYTQKREREREKGAVRWRGR